MEERKNQCCKLWFPDRSLQEAADSMIYLDNAATTYRKPEAVYQSIDMVNRCLSVNAGRGSYQLARIATQGLEDLRERLKKLIKGEQDTEVVFSGSATLALNQIIGGLDLCKHTKVYVSPFVHNAVARPLVNAQEKCGFQIQKLPLTVDKSHPEIDLEKTEYLFRREIPDYVFLSHVSNVTGYVLPIEKITAMAKEISKGRTKVIIDGAQGLGLIPVDYKKVPFDGYVFAGHKTLYAPFGIAGFYKRKDLKLSHFLAGGTGSDSLDTSMKKKGYEPGSPNISAIAGLYEALNFIEETGVENILAREHHLVEKLAQGLKEIDGITGYIPDSIETRSGMVSFVAEGFRSDDFGSILDEDFHIAVRTGYHCAPWIHECLGDMDYGGCVRVSVSYFTTEEEIDRFLDAVREIMED